MGETITMTKKEAERYDIIQKLLKKEIDGTQAARLLGKSIRQTKRIKANVLKVRKQGRPGIEGVIHGNRGKKSKKRIPQKTIDKILNLRREIYYDFTPTFFQEKLVEEHNIKCSYGTVRSILINKGLYTVKTRKSNKKHFSQRERKASFGEMDQFDGSYHD